MTFTALTMWVGMQRKLSSPPLLENINESLNRIYPLMSCAFQPSYGKIYTLFSSKHVFLTALLIFEIGSVVCATAPHSRVFILGRALASLGSAGIQAGTTLILAECVPLRQRPTWNRIIGSSFAVGSVAGPLLVFT
jgi:MFS family permease